MGTRRKYTRELLEEAVAASTSVAGVLRYFGLNQTGGAHAHLSRTIKTFGLDTSHFRRTTALVHSVARLPPDRIVVVLPEGARRAKPHMLTRALLEVDHVDGDYRNNLAENLRFLCPNCHRQTPNFAGRSRGRYADHSPRSGSLGAGA